MAEKRLVKDWITIKGVHIPIFEKESKQDAYNRQVAKSNEDIKQKQIAENKRQAQQAQSQSSNKLPRRLYLDDMSADFANKHTDILDLGTKRRYQFKGGTNITKVEVFAGKGCSKEFRDAEKYAKRWGGKPKDWQHCSGIAQITNGIKEFTREVHWVQGDDQIPHEAFIKYYKKK